MAQLLLNENCTVTIAHSRSRDLPALCRRADILVAAIGRPAFVKSDFIKPGAIVIDVLASNDGRLPHEKIERIRTLRPDMILMSGGTDGGAVTHVVEMAEYVAAADPRPRFGSTYMLPLVYAGNREAQEQVKKILGKKTALEITDNIRPVLERENLAPARHKIHDLFLEHVMAQAPGYKNLIEMAGAPIMPTPAAVGVIMETIAKREHLNLIGVDIGGATTDVFSVFEGIFNRTVSANLGMSYSISNVLAEGRGTVQTVAALTFTENPAALGYPSFHDAYWGPMFRALVDEVLH